LEQNIETVIVGGGQAGLSVSYYLGQEHREHVILEQADRPAHGGETTAGIRLPWLRRIGHSASRPQNMRVKTRMDLSPGMKLCGDLTST
jgi:cation diffusion facilitator CzcD-associated flavoprotein CzcO